jgi:hypothetical protein
MQLKMLFESLDSYFINYEAREWTTFNYVTNFLNNNDNIKVADEVSFVKEEAFLKLIQEKIEDSRNLISLNYLGLKNHFLLSVPSQNKMNKIKKNKTENNVVFDLLDKIRENDYSKLELRKKLKKATDFDIDNLQYLLKDIEFYLFVETEEFECNFSTEEIEDKLKEFEDQGYTTEKMLTLGYLKEIKIPLLKKDGTPINIEPKSSIYVNKESLLFPYEFYSVYEFKNMVISEIKKHKVDIVETETTSTNPKLKTNLSVPELALLFKLLKDLKPNLFELKSEAELLRFISANFETKKTGDKDISTQKLRILFNQPDNNAAEFWEANLRLLLADVKKLK